MPGVKPDNVRIELENDGLVLHMVGSHKEFIISLKVYSGLFIFVLLSAGLKIESQKNVSLATADLHYLTHR